MMKNMWDKIQDYTTLSGESMAAWEKIIVRKTYNRNDCFITEGQVPKNIAFVAEGLFSQYHTAENGDVVIKRFFPEDYFVASVSAMLQGVPSLFTIRALEPSTVWEYNFHDFKALSEKHPDIINFYIRYIERHWIIEKEPLEISFRQDTAKSRYADFLRQFPDLEPRLKQHEIAAYLGVTPTQLSRIRGGT